MYKLFLSLRYLITRPVSYAAVVVLMLGVAVLLIVTSVMGGFQREFHKKIRGTISDISVDSRVYFGIYDEPALSAAIEKNPHVRATAPYVENIVLIDTRLTKDYGQLKGIEPAREVKIGDFASYLLSPREILEAETEQRPELRRILADMIAEASAEKPDPLAVFRTSSGRPGLVVGVQLYQHMRLRIGEEIKLISTSVAADVDPQKLEEKDIREQIFEVTGVFKTGMYEADKRNLYCTIQAAQEFLDLGPKPANGGAVALPARVSGVNVKLDDYRNAEAVADELKRRLADPSLYVQPWFKVNENLIKAVATEQFLIYFIVFFMIILAGICLTAILTLGVIEKTKDLGILGSIGATRAGLMQIYLWQGGIIGVLGAALGTGAGLLFLKYINEIDEHVVGRIAGRRAFDPSIYYLDRIPTEVSGWTMFWCIVPPVVLGFLLSIYPAYRASTLEPVEALRYE